jgi:hypothetical protein
MLLFGFITFLLSLALMKAVGPLGEAVIASHDSGAQTAHQMPARSVSQPQAVHAPQSRPL